MKTILKIVYVIYGFVIVLMMGYTSYYSFKDTKILDSTSAAMKANNYEEIGKIYCEVFDKENLVTNPTDGKLNIAVLNSLATNNISYETTITNEEGKEEKNEISKTFFERSYLFMLYNIDFKLDNLVVNKNDKINLSGIRFYNDQYDESILSKNNNSYDYRFTQSSKVNTKEALDARTDALNGTYYLDEYTTDNDYLLHSESTYVEWYNSYDLFILNLTQSVINAIDDQIEGSISGFSILNNEGESVYTSPLTMDFASSKLHTDEDTQKLIDLFNAYYDAETDSEKTSASNAFNNYLGDTNKADTFKGDHKDDYCFMHSRDFYFTKSNAWKTAGVCLMCVLCLAIIYVLLFHFKQIRNLVHRKKGLPEEYDGKYSVKEDAVRRETEVKDESKKSSWKPTTKSNDESLNDVEDSTKTEE